MVVTGDSHTKIDWIFYSKSIVKYIIMLLEMLLVFQENCKWLPELPSSLRRQSEKEAELATNTAAVSHRATEEEDGHGGGRGGGAIADLLERQFIVISWVSHKAWNHEASLHITLLVTSCMAKGPKDRPAYSDIDYSDTL